MKQIAPGVVQVATSFVNTYLIGEPAGPWVLVDTGLPGFGWKIRAAAASRFGADARPAAIVLTHGHFDHSGNARQLADHWGVPIFAHRLELPYLTGRSDYPPPDPTVGGCIAQMSRILPHNAVDLGMRLRELPPTPGTRADGKEGPMPGLTGWRWIHTPGHSPGHVAFFREEDRTLLAGDALATMDMDSYLGMITKERQLAPGGSPFICNWDEAAESVKLLAGLEPVTVACGHGLPMGPVSGDEDMAGELEAFANSFHLPAKGRYIHEPAHTDERGVDSLPPRPNDPVPLILAGAALGLAAAFWLNRDGGQERRSRD